MEKKSRETSSTHRSINDISTRTADDPQVPAEDSISIVSIVCRICFDDNKDEPIITPCLCRGSVAFVHTSCLEKWLAESNSTSCELCQHVYETEKIPRYTAKQSVWQWMKQQRPTNLNMRTRQIRCDLIACAILTPLAIVVTYICLFSADYYNQQRYASVPTARWTSLSLLVLIAIMLFGYYLWVYVVVGYHGRMWYYWWQREWVVRYVQPVSTTVRTAPSTAVVVVVGSGTRHSLDHSLGYDGNSGIVLGGVESNRQQQQTAVVQIEGTGGYDDRSVEGEGQDEGNDQK